MRKSADWVGWTIPRALRRAASLWPDQAFLIEGERRLSFADTERESERYARALAALGLRRGDVLATWLPNCIEWVLVWLACCRIGAALVPLNTRYRAHEAEYVLKQSRAKALVMADRLWNTDYVELLDTFRPALPDLNDVLLHRRSDSHDLRSLLDYSGADRLPDEPGAEDTAIIVYTSGTSGRPKGATQAHRILRNGANIGRERRYEPGDVVLGHMPFYHVAGSVATLIPSLQFGQSLALMPSWDAQEALELIARERVNVLGGIPTHFIDLLAALGERSLPQGTIKSAWIGGAPVTQEVARAAVAKLGIGSLAAVYGMTETGGATTYTEWGAPIDLVCQNKGRKIGDFELRIADPITGSALPAGTEGEIQVRGYLVMHGYFRDQAATRAATTADEFFRTGDLGRFDADGNLAITGRLKEMFIIGGTNAYPAEIEAFLQTHPAVAQAVVCGVPDARLGEVCFAFIEPRGGVAMTPAEVVAFCRDRIADYKMPRFVEIVNELPRTATNKIERHRLQAEAQRIAAGKYVRGRPS